MKISEWVLAMSTSSISMLKLNLESRCYRVGSMVMINIWWFISVYRPIDLLDHCTQIFERHFTVSAVPNRPLLPTSHTQYKYQYIISPVWRWMSNVYPCQFSRRYLYNEKVTREEAELFDQPLYITINIYQDIKVGCMVLYIYKVTVRV